MTDLKRTPIFPAYEKTGAKLTNFGGWELPVQFTSIKEEHRMTRTQAGLFDVSHMGQLSIKGSKSLEYLQKMLTNDASKLTKGRAQYSFLCNESGGTIDDLIVYMLGENEYLLVVNASNTEKVYDWLMKHKHDDVELQNQSSSFAQVAIQGPKAEKILQSMTNQDLSGIKFFRFETDILFNGVEEKAIVSRTGYTGEDGFEIYISAEAGEEIWNRILAAGGNEVLPAGLGARDTLRLEAGLPLYGQELSEDITPLEAGYGFAVKLNKEIDFIGKRALTEQNESGLFRKLTGIEMIDKGIPRYGYKVMANEEKIGFVTTGTQSLTLQKSVGLALLDVEYTETDTEVTVEIRNKNRVAKVVETPFYKRK